MVFESILTGLKNLFANKLRSVLSMLGIIFGVGTLVATMSIGEGTKQRILSTIEDLGTNLIRIKANYTTIRKGVSTPGLKSRDVALIEDHSPLIDAIAPLKTEMMMISYGGKQLPTLIQCTDPDFQEIRDFHVERGRFITDRDVQEAAKVCVVGADLAEKLEVDDLLGRTIRLKDSLFLVVGVMEKHGKARRGAFNEDMWVFLPISIAREMSMTPDNVNEIIIKASSAALVENGRDHIDRLMKHFHAGHDDFSIETQEEMLRKYREYGDAFKIALGSIAIVSLIIGGIGIMNILLASVNERIREIGIRKALGANPLDIMLQFLFESLILTVSGGTIGIVIGKIMGQKIAPLLTEHLRQRYEWQAVTSTEIVVSAFIFAVVTGFIFGLYPAIKASRLDPSEALTYE